MRLWLLIALVFALAPLGADDLDPVEHFGSAYFTPATDDPHSGTLQLALRGALPHFVDLHSSGDGDVADRFRATPSGLEVRADEQVHRTCEAALDLGVDKLALTLKAESLDRGATLAVHLRALDPEKGRDYLCEVRRNADGSYVFQLRVGDGARFNLVPGAQKKVAEIELPCELSVKLQGGRLSFQAAGQDLSVAPQAQGGLRVGVAVSDGTARVTDLRAEVTFATIWAEDAARRQAARRALMRLRELAVGGLLQGVWAFDYPATDAQRAEFNAHLAQLKPNPLDQPAVERANALAEVARNLPENPLAQHRAGVAALMAGNVAAGTMHLELAHKLSRNNATLLALAEARRRSGNLSAAQETLDQASNNLPAALKPDHQLLLARLQAARGDLPAASTTLEVAARTWPEHEALQGFALSAQSLTQPETLQAHPRAGPLGLRLLSDLPEKQVGSLLARLEPYLEKFRLWLPNLPKQLAGTVVIYAGPQDYLNSALIVASDNLDNVAGMYLPVGMQGKPTVLACRGFGEEELLRTLVHELWHLAYAAAPGGKEAPRWLNEGMAVFLSAGQLRNTVMTYDRLPAEFEDGVTVSAETIARSLACKGLDFYLPGTSRANYAAGWAMVWQMATSGDSAATLRKLLAGDAEAMRQLEERAKDLAPALAEKLARLQKDN